eukprot:TRINITY_DN5488_c1_g1_i1.p1 TRINITY_DN5488_c1_g1~~TRINITY_DN5488_c1_g1_i1.p1  ORF type:complete len:239 (-),score=45.55 TRINITY_DN5488_c1_g1_i1:184-900(-)
MWVCCYEEGEADIRSPLPPISVPVAKGCYFEEDQPDKMPLVEVSISSPAIALTNIAIKVDKSSGDPLGVTLDKNDPLNLLVVSFSDGLIKSQLVANSLEVKPGFRVAKVNGTSGTADEMIASLMEARAELEIEFEPFTRRELNVRKDGKKMGVALAVGTTGLWITVTKVEPTGAIPEINATLAEDEQVKVHDKIAMIDGTHATAEVMLSWMQERPCFTVTLYSWKSLRMSRWLHSVFD